MQWQLSGQCDSNISHSGWLPRVEIDPNVRTSGDGTYAGIEDLHSGTLAVGCEVVLFESESSIEGRGWVRKIDTGRGLVYFDVDWSSFREVAVEKTCLSGESPQCDR